MEDNDIIDVNTSTQQDPDLPSVEAQEAPHEAAKEVAPVAVPQVPAEPALFPTMMLDNTGLHLCIALRKEPGQESPILMKVSYNDVSLSIRELENCLAQARQAERQVIQQQAYQKGITDAINQGMQGAQQ